MEKTDSELYSAWADGDASAGDELIGRHYERVRRMIASKVIDHVDDLTQATFLATLEAQTRFREESSFSTFLFSVLRHKLFQHYRSQNSRSRHDSLGEFAAVDLGPSPSSLVSRKSRHDLLLLALNEIPVDSQIALELYYWEGMSASQVAQVLDLKEAGVRSRLRRAKEQLREAFEAVAPGPTSDANLDRWADSLTDSFGELGRKFGKKA